MDTHTMAASGLRMSHTAAMTDSTVVVNPTPNAKKTGLRSSYMLSVALIMLPSGPLSAMLEPKTDNAVDCATTKMLEQNAAVIVM